MVCQLVGFVGNKSTGGRWGSRIVDVGRSVVLHEKRGWR